MIVEVLGVPDSAGAYCVGVEDAPAALRATGLIEALRATGCEVTDRGDLTCRVWRPDPASPRLQNLDDEIAALRELADAAAPLLRSDRKLLVLGGSCTVAVGVIAGMAKAGIRPRLIYVDRHLDLNTPDSTTEGSLSWMGMAHALAVEGAVAEYAGAAGAAPLLQPQDLVYLGVEATDTTDAERRRVEALGLTVIPQSELVANPTAAAQRARQELGAGGFAAHVDVDVLDFLDAPLAENLNGRGTGPRLDQLAEALGLLVRDPDCRCLSIGQLEPHHARSDPTSLPRLVGVIGAALSPA